MIEKIRISLLVLKYKIEYPFFNLKLRLLEIIHEFKVKKCKKLYSDYNGDDEYNYCEVKFIWGIKSHDDLLKCCDANLYTMNDIDIYYNRKTKEYVLGIETAYMFDNKHAEVEYLQDLLNRFTEFMIQNNYNTNDSYMFWMCNPVTSSEAKSIPELYTNFKIFVEGYKVLYGVVKMKGKFETEKFETLCGFIKPLLQEDYQVSIKTDSEGVFMVEYIMPFEYSGECFDIINADGERVITVYDE